MRPACSAVRRVSAADPRDSGRPQPFPGQEGIAQVAPHAVLPAECPDGDSGAHDVAIAVIRRRKMNQPCCDRC